MEETGSTSILCKLIQSIHSDATLSANIDLFLLKCISDHDRLFNGFKYKIQDYMPPDFTLGSDWTPDKNYCDFYRRYLTCTVEKWLLITEDYDVQVSRKL